MKSYYIILGILTTQFILLSCSKEKITKEELGISDIYTEVFEYKDNVTVIDKSFLDEIVSSDDSILIMNNTAYVRNLLKEGNHIVTDLSKLSLASLICFKVNKIAFDDNKISISFENAYLSDVYKKLNYFEKPIKQIKAREASDNMKEWKFKLAGSEIKFPSGYKAFESDKEIRDHFKDKNSNRLKKISIFDKNVEVGVGFLTDPTFTFRVWIDGNTTNVGFEEIDFSYDLGFYSDAGINKKFSIYKTPDFFYPAIAAHINCEFFIEVDVSGKNSLLLNFPLKYQAYQSTNDDTKQSTLIIRQKPCMNNCDANYNLKLGTQGYFKCSFIPKVNIIWGWGKLKNIIPEDFRKYDEQEASINLNLPIKFSAGSTESHSNKNPCNEVKLTIEAGIGTYFTLFGYQYVNDNLLSTTLYEHYFLGTKKCESSVDPNVGLFRVECEEINNKKVANVTIVIYKGDETKFEGTYSLYNNVTGNLIKNNLGLLDFKFNREEIFTLPFSDNIQVRYEDNDNEAYKGIYSKNILDYYNNCKEFAKIGCNHEPDTNIVHNGINYGVNIIGNQIWFKQNLKVTGPENEKVDFNNNTSNYYTWVNLFNSNVMKFYNSGTELYSTFENWNENTLPDVARNRLLNYNNLKSNIIDSSYGLCPDGYHVPSKEEWQELIDHVKRRKSFDNSSDSYFTKYFKANNTWNSNDADDSPIPFCVEPSGYVLREKFSVYKEFLNEKVAYYWTSTPVDNKIGEFWAVEISENDIKFKSAIYNMKFNCRCIKD